MLLACFGAFLPKDLNGTFIRRNHFSGRSRFCVTVIKIFDPDLAVRDPDDHRLTDTVSGNRFLQYADLRVGFDPRRRIIRRGEHNILIKISVRIICVWQDRQVGKVKTGEDRHVSAGIVLDRNNAGKSGRGIG